MKGSYLTTLLQMRILVGFLGERNQCDWWPTAFYEPSSRLFCQIERLGRYLTGCCSDFGLLGRPAREGRPLLPFRIEQKVISYLTYELHFSGAGDNALLAHEDWQRLRQRMDEERARRRATAASWPCAPSSSHRATYFKSTGEEVIVFCPESKDAPATQESARRRLSSGSDQMNEATELVQPAPDVSGVPSEAPSPIASTPAVVVPMTVEFKEPISGSFTAIPVTVMSG